MRVQWRVWKLLTRSCLRLQKYPGTRADIWWWGLNAIILRIWEGSNRCNNFPVMSHYITTWNLLRGKVSGHISQERPMQCLCRNLVIEATLLSEIINVLISSLSWSNISLVFFRRFSTVFISMAWSMIHGRGVLRAKLLAPGRQLHVVPPQLLLKVRSTVSSIMSTASQSRSFSISSQSNSILF